MAEKKEYKEFKRLLSVAIGVRRTQSEFAKSCGISHEHLSRMLNQEYINRPSLQTLNKIALCAADGVTLDMLKAACGYKTEDRPDIQSVSTECVRNPKDERDRLIHALNHEIIAEYSENGPVYIKTDKENADKAVLDIYESLLTRHFHDTAIIKALEYLYKKNIGALPDPSELTNE